VFVALIALAAAPGPRPAGAGPAVQGDVDCDASVNSVDALQVLRSVAGLSTNAGCLDAAGDVDCSGGLSSIDALRILRYVAGLPNPPVDGCSDIGGPMERRPTSAELIEADLLAGEIDEEAALLYKVYEAFGDDRLPTEYYGDDTGVIDSPIMRDVAERWESLSADTRETLAPFFMPPIYEGSWAAQHQSASAIATGSRSGAQCSQGGQPPAVLTGWSRRVTAHFSIWYKSDDHDAAASAGWIAGVIEHIYRQETELMGRYPLSDAEETCNGGDGSHDIYVSAFAWDNPFNRPTALTIGYGLRCERTPAFMLVQAPAVGTAERARDILAHEFFHMIELGGYDLQSNCSEYTWLGEATATYMIDYVYPGDDLEHQFAPDYLHQAFSASLEDPSSSPVGPGSRNGYEDYLYLFYLARRHSPTTVRNAWDAVEAADSLAALNAGSPGGLESIWPEFTLFNWNRPHVDHYQRWDGLVASLSQSRGWYDFDIALGGQSSRTFEMSRKFLVHLSSNYLHADVIDENVRQIEIDNLTFEAGKFGDQGRGRIQAWLRLSDGTTRVEDWTDRQKIIFCLDAADQDVDEFVIIWSDSTYLDRAHVTNTIESGKVVARDSCITAWEGYVDVTVTEVNAAGEVTTHLTASNVRFERSDTLPVFGEFFRAVDGTVQWTESGTAIPNCTISGAGNYPVNTNNTFPDPYARDAWLRIWDDGGDALRYEAYGRRDANDLNFGETKVTCPDPEGGPPIVIDTICFNCGLWWITGAPDAVFRLEDDGTRMSGTYTMGPDQEGRTSTWTWEFRPAPGP
jgi:hypothetical protein